jgi:hypothetical protein
MNKIEKLGDNTSKSTVPDFESGKGYYWMKQSYQARINGTSIPLPRKPRRTLAERSFYGAVDRRLSRSSTSVDISFDKNGKRIKEENNQ